MSLGDARLLLWRRSSSNRCPLRQVDVRLLLHKRYCIEIHQAKSMPKSRDSPKSMPNSKFAQVDGSATAGKGENEVDDPVCSGVATC
ncbi:hypothetical protein D8674_004556 [Pyrus ussuriensis x Pyrus communis]|uniref:Uncharacterized protein n=1 Tax=Pyrus ussuriensis x Pyrus communis TaxID=2448454 RepID=A0A5N5FPI6_9ROSA|nr:hypothetical protein D8674_004556 [Pyrus ussuriensis x Pyrus communis]